MDSQGGSTSDPHHGTGIECWQRRCWPSNPGVLNQPHEKAFTYPDIPNGNATIPAPTHMNGGSASTQSSSQRNGNKPHAPSSLVTSLQPVAGPPSAVSLASMNALANGSFFGAMGGSQPKEAAPAVKKPVMRIRVATSAGTLLVPTPEDSTVAWLLAEGHARLNRFDKDDEDEREHRQVFTTARSMNGDFIDVSDLVGDVLRDGEVISPFQYP
ncbi:hypothetical protein BC829DRAFT_49538 [Chytridium lagenaria]|nr:hypothetical protein BC829DRAFT_49538 [Chytridium lagenaria]